MNDPRSEASLLAELELSFPLTTRVYSKVRFAGGVADYEQLAATLRIAEGFQGDVEEVITRAERCLSLTKPGRKTEDCFICGSGLTLPDFVLYERLLSDSFTTTAPRDLAPYAAKQNRPLYKWLRIMEAPLLKKQSNLYAMVCGGKEGKFDVPAGHLRSAKQILFEGTNQRPWSPKMLTTKKGGESSIRILTYNIFSSDVLKKNKSGYSWLPKGEYSRMKCLMSEVAAFEADFASLCEVDKNDFEREWKTEYPFHHTVQKMNWGDIIPIQSEFKARPKHKNSSHPDGICFLHTDFVKRSEHKTQTILYETYREVGVLFGIDFPQDTRNIGCAVLADVGRLPYRKPCLFASTHLYWKPSLESYKVFQSMLFRGFIQAQWHEKRGTDPLSAIVTGDFNAIAHGELYNAFKSPEQKTYFLPCSKIVGEKRGVISCPHLSTVLRGVANVSLGIRSFKVQLEETATLTEGTFELWIAGKSVTQFPLTSFERIQDASGTHHYTIAFPKAIPAEASLWEGVLSTAPIEVQFEISFVNASSIVSAQFGFGLCDRQGSPLVELRSAYEDYPSLGSPQIDHPEAVNELLEAVKAKSKPADVKGEETQQLRQSANQLNTKETEVAFTTFSPKDDTPFIGCIDYVFHTPNFVPTAVARLPTFNEVKTGLPDGRSHHSDHLPLCVDFALR